MDVDYLQSASTSSYIQIYLIIFLSIYILEQVGSLSCSNSTNYLEL